MLVAKCENQWLALKKIDHFKEELRISREFHTQRLQRYRDEEGDLQGAEYDDDGFGNLHLVGQRKDPSTHPSKPQELKNPSTYPSAPVSAQSVKADSVISRGTPFPLRQNLSSIKPLF